MPRIDDYPNLCASPGKAKVDTIRLHQLDQDIIGGSRTRWTENPHMDFLAGPEGTYVMTHAVDDILSGACSMCNDGAKQALSHIRLFAILAFSPRVSTEQIQYALSLEERQARRYLQAAKLAIQMLSKHRDKLTVHTVPRTRALTLAEIRAAH